MSVRDKSIIVTGASEGIGRALCLQLARQGARVVAAARSAAKLEALVAEGAELDGEVLAVPTDVGDEASCRALIETCVERLGGIDVLVNNAGISMSARFDQVENTALFAQLMQVNYLGTVYCTYHALPHLKQRQGVVVGVSSLQGKLGFPLSTGYAASKHAVQGFFDSLRIELEPEGVAVVMISPGPVATEIHARKLGANGEAAHSGEDFSDRKQMTPETCANLIVRAIERRRRELVMTSAGKLAVVLKPLFPRFVDKRVAKGVEDFYRKRDASNPA